MPQPLLSCGNSRQCWSKHSGPSCRGVLGHPYVDSSSSHLLGWWEGEKDDTESHESISVSGVDPGLTDGFITGVRGVWHGQCPQLQSLLALPLLLDGASFLSISACGTSPRGHSILLAWGEAEGTGTEPAPETACSSRPHRCSLPLQVDRHCSEAGQG